MKYWQNQGTKNQNSPLDNLCLHNGKLQDYQQDADGMFYYVCQKCFQTIYPIWVDLQHVFVKLNRDLIFTLWSRN